MTGRDELRALAEAALCEVAGATRVTRLCRRCGSSSHGRPRLVGSDLAVSMSYAAGLALVAWGPGPVGIDVEEAGAPVEGVGDRLAWTRIEALLKATGVGLGAWSPGAAPSDLPDLPELPTRTLDVPGHAATLAGDGEWAVVRASLASTSADARAGRDSPGRSTRVTDG